MLLVALAELAGLALLLNEDLDHRHARDVLLKESIDPGDRCPDPTVTPSNLALEDHGGREEQGNDRQTDECQTPVEPEHQDHDSEQRDEVSKDVHDARREQVVEHIDIRCHPGNDPSDRSTVEVGEIETLDMTEDLDAQVEHDLLTRPVGHIGLRKRNDELDDQHTQVEHCDLREAGGVPLLNVIVDRDFGQQRTHQPKRRSDGQQDDGKQNDPAIRTQIAKQPAGQPVVIDLSEALLFVEGSHCSMSSSSLRSCLRCSSA